MLYRLEGNNLVESQTITLPDYPTLLSWHGRSHVLAATKKQAFAVDVSSGTFVELCPSSGWLSQAPVLSSVPGTPEVLVVRGNSGTFVSVEGRPTRKMQLTWPDAPLAVVVSHAAC